jgi:hypothetical protein
LTADRSSRGLNTCGNNPDKGRNLIAIPALIQLKPKALIPDIALGLPFYVSCLESVIFRLNAGVKRIIYQAVPRLKWFPDFEPELYRN